MFQKGRIVEDRYVLIQEIGTGSFSRVYSAFDELNGILVAIKFVNMNCTDPQLLSQEVNLNRLANRFSPDHTVKLLNEFKFGDLWHCLVLEYMLCSLDHHLKSLPQRFLRLEKIREVGKQLFHALESFVQASSSSSKSFGLIHADIKPGNVLIEPDSFSVKLGDFGLSSLGCAQPEQAGTLQYMAPEMLFCLSYDSSVDVWAAGCTLFEFFSGMKLFNRCFLPDVIDAIVETCGMPPSEFIARTSVVEVRQCFVSSFGRWLPANKSVRPSKFGLKEQLEAYLGQHEEVEIELFDSFVDLLQGILKWKPNERLTPFQALKHPFFEEWWFDFVVFCWVDCEGFSRICCFYF